MDLIFKELTADDAEIMIPFYTMRSNRTCDSVFLESFIWKDMYHVRYAGWEGRALLWLMEEQGESFSAMPLCREEDLKDAFLAIENYFNEVLGKSLVIRLADEEAVQRLCLPEEKYLVEEQEDARDYLYCAKSLQVRFPEESCTKRKTASIPFCANMKADMCTADWTVPIRNVCGSFWICGGRKKGEDVERHLDYEVTGIHSILHNCFPASHSHGRNLS